MNAATSKVAMVTGAGTGIGRAVSVALARDGYELVLAGRRLEPLETVALEIQKQGHRALAVKTDVTSPQSVRELFGRVRSELGRLDVLFNNAGTNTRAVSLEELTAQEWRSVIDVNLSGAFYCT